MAFWNRRAKEQRAISPTQAFIRGLGLDASGSPTGKSVTPTSAIEGTIAVYAAVSIIADSVSTLPMHVYQKADDDTRDRLGDDAPLQRLLHRRPNDEMTAQEFYEALTTSMCLWGNGYALIDRDGNSTPTDLWPLDPARMSSVFMDRDGNILDRVDPRRTQGLRRVYVYELADGAKVGINREQILHVRALATDGFDGLSPITVARNAVALEQAATEFGARFFNGDGIPAGILTMEDGRGLKPEDKRRIRSEWNRLHGGLSNAHKVAILEGGVKYQQMTMPLEDAQFVATRRFQIEEVARLYRIPPHMVGDVERSTSWGTGIEQQSLGFLRYTLRPWLERIEQAIDRDLGPGRGGPRLSDRGVFAEFLVEGLLRADTKARWESYEIAIRNRGMVPNEARKKENLPPLEGGDDPFVPVNMGPPQEAPGGTVVIDDDGNVTGGQVSEGGA